jgi:hypothetical protein
MLRRSIIVTGSVCVLSMRVRRAYEARLFPTTVTVSIPEVLVCNVVTSVAGFACASTSDFVKNPPTLPITASVSKPALSFLTVSFIALSLLSGWPGLD